MWNGCKICHGNSTWLACSGAVRDITIIAKQIFRIINKIVLKWDQSKIQFDNIYNALTYQDQITQLKHTLLPQGDWTVEHLRSTTGSFQLMNLMMVMLLSVSVCAGLSQDWSRAGACLLLAGLALACPCYHNNNRLILCDSRPFKTPYVYI